MDADGGVDGDAISKLANSFNFLLGDPARMSLLSSLDAAILAKSNPSLTTVSQSSSLDTSVLTSVPDNVLLSVLVNVCTILCFILELL